MQAFGIKLRAYCNDEVSPRRHGGMWGGGGGGGGGVLAETKERKKDFN